MKSRIQFWCITRSWRFWAVGGYIVRKAGKMPVVTIGLGPFRINFVLAKELQGEDAA